MFLFKRLTRYGRAISTSTRVNLELTQERFPEVRFLETREIY